MARPRKPEHEKLTRTIAWRVTEAVKHELERQYAESGLAQAEFLRELLERRKPQIIARRKPTPDLKRALFLFNKTSNNINQIAHRANTDHLEGVLSEERYRRILSELQEISAYMKSVIKDAD
ncbi:plasmid mobilization protein [Burkholderia multivorans]|uniref:plasmid mobilization protein n=1 Tax=Burkholderia multivorans TaxID=87883 RepID=UPI000CFFAE88|nr:plasmid mobilization relaxosome protein MobC [Burkholderia multivorans]PRG46671.1 plasmid mobilization relaxosome protein MobC [Burkholderia multivorans]